MEKTLNWPFKEEVEQEYQLQYFYHRIRENDGFYDSPPLSFDSPKRIDDITGFCEEISRHNLFVLNCNWEQSAKIIQMSRINEYLFDEIRKGEREITRNYQLDFDKSNDIPFACCNYPFNYFFSGDPQICKAKTLDNATGRMPWNTPFLFLRLALDGSQLTPYGRDEYGFYEEEYKFVQNFGSYLREKYSSEVTAAGVEEECSMEWNPRHSRQWYSITPKTNYPFEHIRYGKQFDIYKIRDTELSLYRIEMIPVRENVIVLPCSYRLRNPNSEIVSKLFCPPIDQPNLPVWGEEKISNPKTEHIILYHNPGILRMEFFDQSIVTACVLGGHDLYYNFTNSKLLEKNVYILINSQKEFDITYAMILAPQINSRVRFLLIESATAQNIDCNWDGVMYPGTCLSDMKIREITPDELRKLAEENNIDIPEGYNQYFPQS